jgi:hypothetical protein
MAKTIIAQLVPPKVKNIGIVEPTRTKTIGKVEPHYDLDVSVVAEGSSRFTPEKLTDCIRAKNALVDAHKAVENEATYAECWAYDPTIKTPLDRCNAILVVRRSDGTRPADADVQIECRARIAAIEEANKKGFWDFLGDAVDASWESVKGIPVVGDVLDIAVTGITSPIIVAVDIANGERVDKAIVGHFERELGNIKKAAPYAQMVISFVPGIGTLASGAIAVGLALANGQPIDEAIIAGVKNALPGGPVTAAAFDVGQGIISGKPIEEIGIGVLPIPDQAKQLVLSGAKLTRAIASGEPVSQVILDETLKNIPASTKQAALSALQNSGPVALADTLMQKGVELVPAGSREAFQKAIVTGMSLGQGQSIQTSVADQLRSGQFTQRMLDEAKEAIAAEPILQNTMRMLSNEAQQGFQIASAVLRYKLSMHDLMVLRENLGSAEGKRGFDTGMALHIGRVKSAQLPLDVKNYSSKAGYLITKGLTTATPVQRLAMINIVRQDPVAREGAIVAIKEIAVERMTLWQKIKNFLGRLGFGPKPV